MFAPLKFLPSVHDPFKAPDLRWLRAHYLV